MDREGDAEPAAFGLQLGELLSRGSGGAPVPTLFAFVVPGFGIEPARPGDPFFGSDSPCHQSALRKRGLVLGDNMAEARGLACRIRINQCAEGVFQPGRVALLQHRLRCA